jgi:hypothetical protein
MTEFNKFFTDEIAKSVIEETATEEVKEIIVGIYKKVFRKDLLISCKQCFADGFFELYNFWKSNEALFLELFDCEYSLRAGVLLQLFGDTSDMATKDNITNALAEKHLKENPACIQWFEKAPEDWYERTEVMNSQLSSEEEKELELKLEAAAEQELIQKAEEENTIPAQEETPAEQINEAPAKKTTKK